MKLKINLFLFATVLLFSQAVAQAQATPSDGPRAVAVAPVEQVIDEGKGAGHHVFPAGWCTRYAADTYRTRTRRDVTWSGDAKDWGVNAAKQGFLTSSDPSAIVPNSILVFGPTKSNAYGHVAIAERVVKGDYVEVSEQNWVGFGVVSRRKIKFSDLRTRYGFTRVILP